MRGFFFRGLPESCRKKLEDEFQVDAKNISTSLPKISLVKLPENCWTKKSSPTSQKIQSPTFFSSSPKKPPTTKTNPTPAFPRNIVATVTWIQRNQGTKVVRRFSGQWAKKNSSKWREIKRICPYVRRCCWCWWRIWGDCFLKHGSEVCCLSSIYGGC